MQRIARLPGQNADEALDGYADLRRILSRYLPPSTVNMYAKPKQAEGGVVEWYSEFGGQPVSLYQLDVQDPKQAAEARRLLAQRLQAVQKAADSLYVPGEDSSEQTERLRRLLQLAARVPEEKNIYVLEGQPVITAWGGGEPLEPPEVPLVQTPPPRKRRWWLWLLLLLALLALLAALLWWLYCREPKAQPPVQEPPKVEEPVIDPPQEEPEPPVEEPLEEPPVEEVPEPEPPVELPPPPEPPKPPPPPPDPLAKLRERIKQAGNDCKALQQLQKSEPRLKENPELNGQVTQKLLEHCKAQMISQAKDLCPEERPPELAPEMVIVFDASGSMDISLLATPEEIKKASMTQGAADLLTGILLGSRAPTTPGVQHLLREPKRITAARQATTAVVEQLPKDVSAGLVLVERCPGARSIGFFAPAQRGQLLRRLKGVVPMEGTPLADGISRAGAMLDGVNRESVMLVVSDGEESCNQDPCAVARDLARRKPHLKINVVDILGTGAGNCLAAATGGQVFTASTVSDLQLMTKQAAKDVLPPAHCRP